MRIGRTLPPAATPITVKALVSGIWGIFRGRRELDRLESELKAYFGAEHCFLVSSGKAAFTLILLALKELSPERDEVLIPAFTCYSVPSAAIRAGLRVRLCDLQADSLDFDFDQLSTMLDGDLSRRPDSCSTGGAGESLPDGQKGMGDTRASINKFLAIVPTHLFGYPSDVARLRKMKRDQEITIVEDAAQAMGETVEEGKLGTFGDVSFFSLARGKAFSVVEGGVIITNRADIAKTLDRLVNGLSGYGLLQTLTLVFKAIALMMFTHPRLFWIPRSIPSLKLGETLFETDFSISKMSSFQAGLARNWQGKLAKLRDARKRTVGKWIATIEASGTHSTRFFRGRSMALLRFPLQVNDKNEKESLLNESVRLGLGIMPVYPTSIDAIPELEGMTGSGKFPVAETYASGLVTLPTHGYLSDRDVEKICGLICRLP